MDLSTKCARPPWPAVILGVPALICTVVLEIFGRDEKGLFVDGHPATVILWLLTAAMVITAVWSVRPYGKKAKYKQMFPANTWAAGTAVFASTTLFSSALNIWNSGNTTLEIVASVLGFLSAVAMMSLAMCRYQGNRGSYLSWALVTVFLMLRLMFAYREWSAEPALMAYFFPLMASVCLLLVMYYRTAISVGMGNVRMYLLLSQLAAFFCLAATVIPDKFYFGMALWCLVDLPDLDALLPGSREDAP